MYPIEEILEEVYNKYSQNQVIIVSAPTGTGKSTVLPLYLLEHSKENNDKIIMLEPRRLAAKAIAHRIADLKNEKLGQSIGYSIRFESVKSEKTRLEVVTEGVLTRMLLSDNELKGVSTIIFDEFHERSLNADLSLALVRECQNVLRNDLKIIIMSATIETDKLSKLLNAPVIIAKSKSYDVKIFYQGLCDEFSVTNQTALTILKALNQHNEGDVLAFLPGEAEIRKCEELLKKSTPTNIVICPLYSMLNNVEQKKAILPDSQGRRKIVLATSIAETSLTIEGVKIVVDSGFTKILEYDADRGLSGLKTVRISLDMAQQRSGRAGRLSEGFCYRLWDLPFEAKMRQNRRPEIEYADLTPLTLDLLKWGEPNPENLFWLSAPDKANVNYAKETLKMLEASDEKFSLTPLGEKISKIPVHPRIAKMLVESQKYNLASLACDIAAILDNKDPLDKTFGTDINLRIEKLRQNRKENRHNKKLDRIELYACQLRKLLNSKVDNNPFDSFDTGFLIAQAFPERIASAKQGNNAQFMLSNSQIAALDHNDSLAGESWISIASLNTRENGIAKIFLASPLDPSMLKDMIKEKTLTVWNTKKGGVVSTKQLKLFNIILQETPIKPDSNKATEIVLNAIEKEGENILDFGDEVKKLINRILSLRVWDKDGLWPDVSIKTLTENPKWIIDFIQGKTTVLELKKIDLVSAIKYSLLDYKKQEKLDSLAPNFLTMPNGHKIKLEYFEDGKQPILSVRLQEVFQWKETPKICNGTIPVLLQLLSPGFKPVQLTSDLKSFWQNTYKEVRKELKRRYPKHSWPEEIE